MSDSKPSNEPSEVSEFAPLPKDLEVDNSTDHRYAFTQEELNLFAYTEFLELVGEDEIDNMPPRTWGDGFAKGCNVTKANLRVAAKKRYGQDD